jgi:mRNA-degrading endonuclease RelE of RelBE toxin-antitoxin system
MWQVVYARTCLKELAGQPSEVRQRVEKIVFGEEIESDPRLGGRVQPLAGYRRYFKIRVGNYRIGLLTLKSRWLNFDECCIAKTSIVGFRKNQ